MTRQYISTFKRNLLKEKVNLDFRQKIDETKNFLLEEIKKWWLNEWKSQKIVQDFKLLWKFSFFISAISGCVSTSAFASLVGDTVGIASSATGLKVCAITTGINMYNSVIQKKMKKHNKKVLLVKTKLNRSFAL